MLCLSYYHYMGKYGKNCVAINEFNDIIENIVSNDMEEGNESCQN